MTELLYILLELAFFILFAVGGILLGVEGVRFGRKHGVGGDEEFSAKKSDKEKSFALKGVITWVGFGVACVVTAFAVAYWGLVPRLGDYLDQRRHAPDPSPTVTVVQTPAAAPPTVRAITIPDPVSFKTPRGVVCSTYLKEAAMACVIPTHTWGVTSCAYAFIMQRTGAARVAECPDEEQLSADLSGYPDANQSFADKDYGKVFDMGVAVCAMTGDGTYCVNSDRHYIRLSKEHSHPKV